jgi:protease-4
MAGLAASGGYYVSCAGDHVFAQPSTLTGNIGVIFPMFNASQLAEKWGIEDASIESSGTPYKAAGSFLRPLSAEHRAYIQDLADKSFAQFKAVVKQGRTGKGNFDPRKLDQIANGKIYLTEDAIALGLVDEKGYLQDACDYAANKANLSKPTVVRFQDPQGLLSALLDGKSDINPPSSSSSDRSVTINGVNISAADLRDLLTPRMMYLWRGR